MSSIRILRGRRRASGQAIIEVAFSMILFLFIALLVYEGSIVIHNLNVINNCLKQAAWIGAMGAPDDDIMSAIASSETQLAKSGFFACRASDFGITVWTQTPTGEIQLAPGNASNDWNFSPGAPNRAAYIWRANNYNLRVGLKYYIAYSSTLYGVNPIFSFHVDLVSSQTIMGRNDEDRDGMVDLYEPELWCGNLGGGNFYLWGYTDTPLSHRDRGTSDTHGFGLDIDGDGLQDLFESNEAHYDFSIASGVGWMDKFDPDTPNNRLRNPLIGGEAVVLPE